MTFIEQHIEGIVSVGGGLAVWLITIGAWRTKIEALLLRVDALEEHGTMYARENIQRIEQQIDYATKRLGILEIQQNEFRETLGEIHTSVKVIEISIKHIESSIHRKT